jgi:hypothetical protein
MVGEAETMAGCPECGRELVDIKKYLFCREHGVFDRSLRRVEITKGELRIAGNMASYQSFIEKLEPSLQVKTGFLIKSEKWRVDWAMMEDQPDIMFAERVGVSIYRPGTGGPWTSYQLIVEYYPDFPPEDAGEEVRKALEEGFVQPLDKDYLETVKERFSKAYGGRNAAGLDVIFTPEITREAAEYCREQKTLLKLGMHGLAQIAFVAVNPEYRVVSMVSDRLRGYVKHHFPEAYSLLSEMEGWR